MPTSPRDFFVVGGTMQPDAPSYIEREADRELFEPVLAGDFCYVLTPRQMGKSSLMARTAKRLQVQGVCTAIVDRIVYLKASMHLRKSTAIQCCRSA